MNGPEALDLLPVELPAGEARALAFVSTRRGGLSRPPYASLNLSLSVGDDPARVAANRQRLEQALGMGPRAAVLGRQVHGAGVWRLGPGEGAWDLGLGHIGAGGAEGPVGPAGATDFIHQRPAGPSGIGPSGKGPSATGEPHRAAAPIEADALVSDTAGLCPMVLVADCVPLLLWDPRRPAVGVAHAGWRGTVAGIAGRTVAAMAGHFGSRPAELWAFVGPSIGPEDFEVGPEVAAAFRAAFGRRARRLLRAGRGDRSYVDLWEANVAQLREAGLARERIALSGISTARATDRFYSHRAEGGPTGRFAAGILLGA